MAGRMVILAVVVRSAYDGAVLVELDAPREGAGPRGRGDCSARGGILLLVVCVLFELFVIGIVQYLELFFDRITISSHRID